ncbi:Starch/carbohydrate-binding protein [Neomoorella glycerini]|uniref:Starch/carbohydrate-binding protein n=1 Tax=Neomoorella glycerini TaxID=55779 RepID=A0A6I5ZMQ0_9FIRM|nr:carbohydrate-binding protein [Moorella glycerini]QGP91163.1 Starch/carbohydrate-binding protein [Moorella glycerini]
MGDKNRSRFVSDEGTRLQQMRAAEYPGGVVVDPVPITAGDEVTILYHGLLDACGADQVWLHTGYGDANSWQNIYDYRMERTGYGWVKNIRVEDGSRLNICFKDSANNWDNNNGLNWSFEIHNGNLPGRK